MVVVDPTRSDGPAAFYDSLAATYDRLYPDWAAACSEQGKALHRQLVLDGESEQLEVLDAAVGIGTQLLGLAECGHRMTGTDISQDAVRRAQVECDARGIEAELGVADMRDLPFPEHRFDALVCADNALAHLVTHADVVACLREFRRVTRPGGVILVSIRDCEQARREQLPGTLPQVSGDSVAFQVWTWHNDRARYDLQHFQLIDEEGRWQVTCRPATLWALTRAELSAAAEEAEVAEPRWLMPDRTGFFQPILRGQVV
jgi:SAM-dependent methyltransferase